MQLILSCYDQMRSDRPNAVTGTSHVASTWCCAFASTRHGVRISTIHTTDTLKPMTDSPFAKTFKLLALACALGGVAVGSSVQAQWTNRYPCNVGFNHQVYLEGYELPIMANGPTDVAPSPDGRTVIVASRGWLWQMDMSTKTAKRLTSTSGMVSRPAWSADGRSVAFVRDDSRETSVVCVTCPAAANAWWTREWRSTHGLIPMGPNSRMRISGVAAIWICFLLRSAVAVRRGLFHSLACSCGRRLGRDGSIIYLSKTRSGGDQVVMRRGGAGEEIALLTGNIISQTRPALSPDGSLLAYNWPGVAGWELQLLSTDRLGAPITLVARPRGRPYAPAWSADGKWIYYSQADDQAVFHLYRVAAVGGKVEEVRIEAWDYGVPTSTLQIISPTPGSTLRPRCQRAPTCAVDGDGAV